MCINNSKFNQLKCSLKLTLETYPMFAYLFSKAFHMFIFLLSLSIILNPYLCWVFMPLFTFLVKDPIQHLVPNLNVKTKYCR